MSHGIRLCTLIEGHGYDRRRDTTSADLDLDLSPDFGGSDIDARHGDGLLEVRGEGARGGASDEISAAVHVLVPFGL